MEGDGKETRDEEDAIKLGGCSIQFLPFRVHPSPKTTSMELKRLSSSDLLPYSMLQDKYRSYPSSHKREQSIEAAEVTGVK